jgi:acetyl/propionyl-CoA carboxylase alpha subunit
VEKLMPGFFLLNGNAYPVALIFGTAPDPRGALVAADGDHVWIHYDGCAHELIWQDAVSHHAAGTVDKIDDIAMAPMPGTVVAVLVVTGDIVRGGDTMVIIESMKLETSIKAPRDGVVQTVHTEVGLAFERDAMLVSLRRDIA